MNELLQLQICGVGLWWGLMMLYHLYKCGKRDEQFRKVMIGIRERTFVKELKRLEGDKNE